MSEHVQIIETEDDFNTAIQSGVALVDFFATWCGPCRMQGPILEQFAGEIGNTVKVVKIDTDKFAAIASKYDISSIPTMILFKNGQVVDRLVGLQQADKLKYVIEGILN
jgi:thioredoxin 1